MRHPTGALRAADIDGDLSPDRRAVAHRYTYAPGDVSGYRRPDRHLTAPADCDGFAAPAAHRGRPPGG